MRAAWLTAGALVTVFALLVSTVLIWRGFAWARIPQDFAERSIPFSGQELRIKVGKGDVSVSIVPGKAGEVLLGRSLRWSRDRPTITEDWDARSGTLRLEALCTGSGQPDGPMCEAHYTVFVPPETDIDAGTVMGRLSANSLYGDLRLTTVSGDVLIEDLAGALWARAGTGNVHAAGLHAENADVEVGTGDVTLNFVGAPTKVQAVVRTTGYINIGVPEGSYDVTVDARNSTLDVKKDTTSDRKITAKAPNGTVSVCCR